MTDKVHVFYHKKDLDGHCSGAIVKYALLTDDVESPLPSAITNGVRPEEIEMWPYDYGEPFPFDKIPDGDIVYMVDITTNPYEVMLEIQKRYHLFIVDHHKSFIESDVAKQITKNKTLKVGTAACELTWQSMFPSKPMPRLVHLLGRYDIWDNSDKQLWENQILATQMGMKMRSTDPGTDGGFIFWEEYFKDCLYQVAKIGPKIDRYHTELEVEINRAGAIILRYQSQEDAKACAFYSFPAKFEQFNALCLNSTRFNSQVYKSIWDNTKYDIMLAWVSVQGERCSVSLYTDKEGIDVSEIAKSFGGGGHKQAAGFQCKNVKPITNMLGEKAIIIDRFT